MPDLSDTQPSYPPRRDGPNRPSGAGSTQPSAPQAGRRASSSPDPNATRANPVAARRYSPLVPPQPPNNPPARPAGAANGSPRRPRSSRPLRLSPSARRTVSVAITLAITVLLLSAVAVMGAVAGYRAEAQAHSANQSGLATMAVKEQFELAVQDQQAGRLEVARQRFEYVIAQDPAYPGAAERLADVMAILYATATPTPLPPTVTPTPTRDLRPVQDLFTQAQNQMAAGDWSGAIDTITALRKEDPNYNVLQVDGILYLALRNRGLESILKSISLEGGMYDLALAERFGPLDVEASSAREWARLFAIGNSFWEAYPERAVYYFSQVAAAAPYLRDASGWTARERYRAALVQYGDALAKDSKWCEAQEQYELALSMNGDVVVQSTAVYAAEQCSPPTATFSPTETQEPTFTPTATWPVPTTEPPPVVTTEVTKPTTAVPTTQAPPPTTEAPPPTTEAPPPTTEPPPATTEPPVVTEPPADTTQPPPPPSGLVTESAEP